MTLEKSKILRLSNLKNLKNFTNLIKNYNFYKILIELLLCFQNSLQFYINIRENLGKKLESFGNMDRYGVRWPSPRRLARIIKIIRKSNDKLQNFEMFHEYLANTKQSKKISTFLKFLYEILSLFKIFNLIRIFANNTENI